MAGGAYDSDSYKDIEQFYEYGLENAKDIISVGCDAGRTFIYLSEHRTPQFNFHCKIVGAVSFCFGTSVSLPASLLIES